MLSHHPFQIHDVLNMMGAIFLDSERFYLYSYVDNKILYI
jgi:hypothetical protein